MGSSPELKVQRLKRGGNYRRWATQMQAHLIELDLDRWLNEDPAAEKPDEVKAARKCKARLQLAVEGGLIAIVEKAATARAAWKALRDDHLGEQTTKRPQLLGELRTLSQGKNESDVGKGNRRRRRASWQTRIMPARSLACKYGARCSEMFQGKRSCGCALSRRAVAVTT